MFILKILITLLIVFLPFGEILRFNLGNNIFLKPLDLISVLLFFWTIIVYLKNKPFRKSLRWFYFFFPLVGLVSLLINSYWLRPNELLASFFYLLRWVSYLSIFFAVIRFEEKFKEKITNFLVVDGLILLLVGYVQFFFYPNLKNLYYLGWDEHLYRMFSSFLDPNFIGTFFVLYFIFIAGLLFQKKRKIEKKTLYFYIFTSILTVIAIFLTYSRSALLMLIVSGITFFLLLQKRKFIFYLLGALVVFVIIISPYFYIENLDLLRVNSSISRFNSANNAIKIIATDPLIGVGFDSYRYAQLRHNLIKIDPRFPSHSASGDDTSLLFVLATTGIIGLASYLYLWFRLVKKAKSNYKKNIFSLIFISSIAGLFVNSLFINSLFYPEIMFWLWLMVALMM
ncbi:MAG TPA: O-antigen ligase family protein [Candidatus Saccharimonadales bacterium]|nr:O-antigen ligase family protein [Candidatus Saccharimonadales bacterium]